MDARARTKKMNPTVITPYFTVSIDSDGSIGARVVPVASHWTTWAMISSWTSRSTPNRSGDIRLRATVRLPGGWFTTGRLIGFGSSLEFIWPHGRGSTPDRSISYFRMEGGFSAHGLVVFCRILPEPGRSVIQTT